MLSCCNQGNGDVSAPFAFINHHMFVLDLLLLVLFQYLKDYQTFANTARYWTEAYAKSSSVGIEEKVRGSSYLIFFSRLNIAYCKWQYIIIICINIAELNYQQ